MEQLLNVKKHMKVFVLFQTKETISIYLNKGSLTIKFKVYKSEISTLKSVKI